MRTLKVLESNSIGGSEEITRALSRDQSTERGESGNRKNTAIPLLIQTPPQSFK